MNQFKYQKIYHFIAHILILLSFFYLQTLFLARIGINFFNIDLVTIFIVYVAIEHALLPALLLLILASTLMQNFSMAPQGFFITYYLLVYIMSYAFTKMIIIHKMSGQLAVFSILLVFKYILSFLAFKANNDPYDGFSFIIENFWECVVTAIVSVPIFKLLSMFDTKFNTFRLKR